MKKRTNFLSQAFLLSFVFAIFTSNVLFAQTPVLEGWTVPVSAVVGNGENFDLTFGKDSLATDGFDQGIDVPSPPVVPGGSDVYFFISTFPTRLAQDFRSYADTTKQWTLRAIDATGFGANTLSWNVDDFPIGDIPGDLTISSPQIGTVNMLTQNSVPFTGTQQFIIHFEAPKDNPPENIPPVADDQDVSTDEDTPVDITLMATDPDDGPLPLTFTIVDSPIYGTLTGTAPNVTYTPQANYHGPDSFTFKADDGDSSDTATVSITVNPVNDPPVANAGPDQDVDEGVSVTLDGTGSFDPDGDVLSYSWTQISGPTVTLDGANTANPTFTALEVAANTELEFKLTVTDNGVPPLSDADSVKVTVRHVNKPPIGNAGDNQNVLEGSLVTLDGSASSDPDGDEISYSWTQIGGPAVTLDGATTAMPTFTAPLVDANTDLQFKLTVTDDGTPNLSDSDTVTVTVRNENHPPVADAGDDQIVDEGNVVTLDGTGSSDPDPGDILSYSWTQISGPAVTLDGANTATPTFTAPEVAADTDLEFKLTVTDDGVPNLSDADTVKVTVRDVNKAPIANAGPDQIVLENTLVTLDGSESSDPDGDEISYSWMQISGPTVTLDGATTAMPTFTAPEVDADTNLQFKLTVTDNGTPSLSDADTVMVTVKNENRPPVANAGPDQLVDEGDLVTLDGTGSSDLDPGDILSYSWAQISGSTVTLNGANTANPTFTAPEVVADSDLEFKLTVTDNGVPALSDADTVKVTVQHVNKAPVANAGADQTVIKNTLVTLDGTDSSDPDTGDILSFSWEQIDGPLVTLDGADTDQPTFTAPDVTVSTDLTFRLTVTDNGIPSLSDQDTVTITVVDEIIHPPVADFIGAPLLGVTPLTVQFTDKSTGNITSWLWDFGDGNTSTEQHPLHTYNVQSDPKFTVSLTVTGPGGSDDTTKVNYIEVLLALEISMEARPSSGLAPLEVAFKSASNIPIFSYSWSFGDGGTSTEPQPVHIYMAPGSYTVTLVTNTPLGRITTRRADFVQVFDCFTKTNLSLISASPAYPGEGWDNAIDGDIDGWNGTVTAEGNPPHAVFGFTDGHPRMIDRVRLLTDTNVLFPGRWVKEFRVLVSTTGTADADFTQVLHGMKTTGAWEDFNFTAAEAKFVKLVIDQPSSGFRQSGEFEVWEALDANPPNAALSSISVSSPHVADGHDAATITIVLKDNTGAPITGKPAIAFKLFVSGSQNAMSAVAETVVPGTYQATLTSFTAETKTVSALLGCTRIDKTPAGDLATVTFDPVPLRLAGLVFEHGSEDYPGEGWDNAIDGDVHDWDGTATVSGNPAFGVFSFAGGTTEKVAAVRLLTDTGVGFQSRWVRRFKILVSTTGTSAGHFTEVFHGEMSGGGWQRFDFSQASAKYVKLLIETPSSGFRQIGEFEVYVVGGSLAKHDAGETAELAAVPEEFSLSQNYPNPFNPETMIRFGLPVATPVRLEVYDLQGRRLRSLIDEALPAGMHDLKWDGLDASGQRVTSGIYFYRLEAGAFVQVKRMTFIK